jgi:hypothetical protein
MHSKTMLTLAALISLAACDQAATGVNADDLSREDAAALAPDYAELADAELAAFGASFDASAEVSADTHTDTTTFTRTRTCPLGGSVKVEGTLTRTGNRETHTGSTQYNATRTEQACAFNLRSGGSITLNGNPNTAVTGSWSVTNGVPGIRTMTQKGSFAWARSNGRTGTCSLDLTATWDPATHTQTVKGTFCNRTIDVTRTRA